MHQPSSYWFSLLTGGAHRPALRLYCFPYAGAGHTVFQHWRAGLPSDIELALIKLPGRGARFGEPRATSLAELAEALTVAIVQASTDGIPFAFFGHSMGALLAFETARRLARQELSPALLLVSARTAPVAHGWRERVADLPSAQFLEVIRGMNGMPRELLDNPEWIELFLPIIRGDFALCEDYRYSAAPPLPCAIHVLAGEADASVPLSLLDGWAQESQAECRTWLFPGGHFYLFEQESELFALLQRLLLSEPLRQVAN
ncbi:thioesterase II family protein [Pseudomonas sediminis]|uniref:Thioesterase n=1 Tax=Pseudomonas sediminis TaxID=1691904 RepID=A0ABX6SNM9_9PSED|nr:alpha/beta fold hydrolase [Pseudomonas sediminis]QNH03087.1 thioesterase [Pseudomonas sediminis]